MNMIVAYKNAFISNKRYNDSAESMHDVVVHTPKTWS